MKSIKIAIVDDQNIFRESLNLLIESVSGFELVASASSAENLLEILTSIFKFPDILIMDMNMPVMNGIELNKVLHKLYPELRVIALSVHAQNRLISKLIAEGASGYLIKNCDKEELIMAIKSAYHTGFYINKQALLAIQKESDLRHKTDILFTGTSHHLSIREKEILELVCKECNSAEIAEKLFISIRTVEGHRNNLLLKTQSRNIAGLVLFAIRNRLFEVI